MPNGSLIAKMEALAKELSAKEETEMLAAEVVRGMFENSPDPLWIKRRMDDGRFELFAINPSYRKYFNITEDLPWDTRTGPFPEELYNQFEYLDQFALKNGHHTEIIKFVNPFTGKEHVTAVTKWSGVVRGITLIYAVLTDVVRYTEEMRNRK